MEEEVVGHHWCFQTRPNDDPMTTQRPPNDHTEALSEKMCARSKPSIEKGSSPSPNKDRLERFAVCVGL